jgi:hemerythrin
VLELQKNYHQKANVSIELLWFLCNWVTHHIKETDAELGRFLDIVNIRRRLSRNGR